MYQPDDWERFGSSWYVPLWYGKRDAAEPRRLGRRGRSARIVTANELETRRFLANEVYRVPVTLLDDLSRLRLKDLDRSG